MSCCHALGSKIRTDLNQYLGRANVMEYVMLERVRSKYGWTCDRKDLAIQCFHMETITRSLQKLALVFHRCSDCWYVASWLCNRPSSAFASLFECRDSGPETFILSKGVSLLLILRQCIRSCHACSKHDICLSLRRKSPRGFGVLQHSIMA